MCTPLRSSTLLEHASEPYECARAAMERPARSGYARHVSTSDRTTDRPRPQATRAGDRILVVDDDLLTSQALERALERSGFDVTVVTDSALAAQLLVEQRFAAIVTDIHMPGLSGVDLLVVARSYDPDVPVILVTGNASLDTAIEAANLGSTQYLLKPISIQGLGDAVRRGIAGRPSRGNTDGLAIGQQLEQLERAIDAAWLAFQPIVSSPHGRLHGYEALLRSDEPSMSNPATIFSAAERLNRVSEVSRRVRSLAASELTSAPPSVTLFVNLHSLDLQDPELFEPAAPLSLLASRVVLELTEREALDEVQDLSARLTRLRALGYRIAVDDLGAGYAGLNSFALVEPDIVKLDMGLVRGVHQSVMKQKVIASVVSLAAETGIAIVAEGVEVGGERDCLVRLGADYLQGYFLGRPVRGLPATP